MNKVIPTIILDYIPQYTFTAIAKVITALLNSSGSLTPSGLCEKTGFQASTIDNLMIDLVMFGIAKKENGVIKLSSFDKEGIIITLQSFFKNHIIYTQLLKKRFDGFSYPDFYELFTAIYASSDINVKTKSVYAAKIFNWLKDLALISIKNNLCYLDNAQVQKVDLNGLERKRRNRYSLLPSENLFWGQASPDRMKATYNLIRNGVNSYKELKSQGYRNGIELLSISGAITKYGDTITINKSLDEVFAFICLSPTIIYINTELTKNPDVKSFEAGENLSTEFSRSWASTSKLRYGNAILLWVRYLREHNYLF